MKRTVAIALVVIMLLNTLGYYGVFIGMHLQHDAAMSEALDADHFENAKMVTLKIAVSMPYMPDQTEFERVDGKFEYLGDYYRLVKQKYAKDELIIVCIKDFEHKTIEHALADYVKTFTDKEGNSKSPVKSSISLIKDYLPIAFSINSSSKGWSSSVVLNNRFQNFIPSFSSTIVHPPERA